MNCVRLRELEVLSYFPQEINKRVILIKIDCDSICGIRATGSILDL